MQVAITGASGNVGTSVLARLSDEPTIERIVAIARRRPAASFAKASWFNADVRSADLAHLFAGVDAVVHLAWLIQPSRDEKETRSVNVRGTERVLRATIESGVRSVVYASSVGAYAPKPPDSHRVDESWPTTGIASSFYSRHKAEVERMLDGFEAEHPEVRVVRLRPALIFKREAASEIRRLFIGPLLPSPLLRPGLLPVLPLPRGLTVQVVHSYDVGEAYKLALLSDAKGAFNIAAEPLLDGKALGAVMRARPVEVSPAFARALAAASCSLRLQPASPGWLDMGLAVPTMDTTRARKELRWQPRFDAGDTLRELIDGLRRSDGMDTPPLDRRAGGLLRSRELRTGVGGASI